MPNVITVLKAEISRIARKEAKQAVAPFRKPTTGARRVLADLKRRVAALEKDNQRLAALLAKSPRPQPASETPEDSSNARGWISGKGVRSLRQKLGLSQQELAKLLGVGNNTIYKWESKPGMLKLRGNTRAVLMSARQLGAREAQTKVAEMKAAKTSKPTAKPTVKRGHTVRD